MTHRVLRLRTWILAAVLSAAPTFAHAQTSDGTCPPVGTEDAVSSMTGTVAEIRQFASYATTHFVQRVQETTFDLRQATDTSGRNGVIGTEPFTQVEIDEIAAIERGIPACVMQKANVRRAFRAKRGVAAERLGIVGIAYAYNNGRYNKEPDGSEVRGGQIVVTDLFFDRQSFNRMGNGDVQMQVAMGWSTCQPPRSLPPDRLGDVNARARDLPESLRRLTRERILFHEYIHGVTHEQEESGWTDPSSVEGFFGPNGVSRYERLRAELYRAGGPLEQLNAKLRTARSREEYCAIYAERTEYLRQKGVPQRWPGDTHALDDRDEYVTILIEQMMYDPQGMTGYSEAEKAWAADWWNYTFNPAYRQDRPYRRIPFGQCPDADRVVGRDGNPTPGLFGYGAVRSYFGGW